MSEDKLNMSYWPAEESQSLIDCSLSELLHQIASEVPDRIALVDGVLNVKQRRRWSYQQLWDISENVARALLSSFSKGDRIAVFAPNSAEWVFLQYGISMAGLVLVPVNPAYSEKELSIILKDAGVSGIFYVSEYRGRDIHTMVQSAQIGLPSLHKLVSFDDWEMFLTQGDSNALLPQSNSNDLLQIQFTSGTTGVPKGACLHHKGVINMSRFVAERAGFPEGGVWINAMPSFHIGGSIVTLLGTLNLRGTYVVVPSFDPEHMLELIESERGSVTLIVPTMIIAMLESPEFEQCDLSSMKTVLTGASEVPAALVRRTKKSFGCDLSILFGQTEVNGVCSQTSINDSEEDQSDTLGRPLPHLEICIVDSDAGEILPIGQAGEILVRGYQNMVGYYGLEKRTKETIRADGWLRTGDMGIMDKRGYLKIAGRIKDMLIRGGMNIYPREIENVLFDHPDISQVSVIGVPDKKWGEVIAAIIIPVISSKPPSPEDLFSYCREHLSAHKTPAQWFYVDAYPLTPSGKVKKFELKDWVIQQKILPRSWKRTASFVGKR